MKLAIVRELYVHGIDPWNDGGGGWTSNAQQQSRTLTKLYNKWSRRTHAAPANKVQYCLKAQCRQEQH